jgi:peptidoglycan/xylan/chitin deacetylase (PgdA/CDA1 family)
VRARLRRAADRALGRPPIVHNVPGASGVALTFDDGPAEWTPEIAAVLERHDCAGTFFMRGAAVERDPRGAAAVAAAGHDVGNHLWSHSDPEEQTADELASEIDRTASTIAQATGSRPALVRPPYCGAPRAVADAARRRGVRAVVLRNVDPADWSLDSAEEIAARVMEKVGPGDIVCMHDGIPDGSGGTTSRAATVAAVEAMVPELLARGLRPVTVSRLLDGA